MTTGLDARVFPERTPVVPPPTGARALALVRDHVVLLAASMTVLLRLPQIARAPGLDEAGFLMVARQWQPGGTSLYGSYWVDRPPLLITIFRVAALDGGLVTLRLIGCLAAALTVLGVAHVAGRIAEREGGRPRVAAAVAAVVGAAWCVSPWAGSTEVNGELLAAPFVVWGIAGTLSALTADRGTSRTRAAALAGAAAVAALLVKQNFVDVGVFFAVVTVISWRRRQLTPQAAGRAAAWFGGGALAAATLLAGWTVAHGTSLAGVFFAMYPFRFEAGQVMASSGSPATGVRMVDLAIAGAMSGLVVVAVLVAWSALRHRDRAGTASVALLGLVAFDLVSVALGGSFWLHYLVQLVVPLAILAGVAAARSTWLLRSLVAVPVSAALALVLSGALQTDAGSTGGSSLGHAVGAASQAGDTIVTLYGHSNVSMESSLSSPYPYLWSLPLKTLDPSLRQLDEVLTGPAAPTWVVTWDQLTSWGVQPGATADILARDYHVAAVLNGHTIYLRDGVSRATPALAD